MGYSEDEVDAELRALGMHVGNISLWEKESNSKLLSPFFLNHLDEKHLKRKKKRKQKLNH